MVVEVKLFAAFREGRFKKKELELPDGSSVAEVLKQIGIKEQEVGMLLVNGGSAAGEKKLSGNDVVSVFPLIGGG